MGYWPAKIPAFLNIILMVRAADMPTLLRHNTHDSARLIFPSASLSWLPPPPPIGS